MRTFFYVNFLTFIYLYTNKEKLFIMANYEFPTEVIELPSKGKVYPESNPLSNGRVEIKYMTAKEEDILASQNLIKKGVVLDKLFESVVVDKDINIDDIVIGDKNAILLATRILGYGAQYEVEINDPFTGEQQRTTIDLAKIQTKEVDESILTRDNIYEYELPKAKKKILTNKKEVNGNTTITKIEIDTQIFLQPKRVNKKIISIGKINSANDKPSQVMLNDLPLFFSKKRDKVVVAV